MEEDFSRFLIKEYKYWEVHIFGNQNYLGRCVVWCKRDDALDLTDATVKEQEELFLILQALRKAVSVVFVPDWYNYSFLGNATRHLHMHFVPRYSKSKIFMGITFEDKLYGSRYKTDHSFITPPEVLKVIREKITDILL